MVSKDKIKELWITAPRGIILWNTCIIGLLTLSSLINIETFLVIQVIGSYLAFDIMLHEDLKETSNPMNLWANSTFTGWVVLIGKGIIGIIQFIYKWTFGYLIKQDEIRLQKYREQQAIERLKKLRSKSKNNQKLLGN